MLKVSINTVRPKIGRTRKKKVILLLDVWFFPQSSPDRDISIMLICIWLRAIQWMLQKHLFFWDITTDIFTCSLQKTKQNTLCKLFYDWALNIPSKGQRKSHSSLHETENEQISSKMTQIPVLQSLTATWSKIHWAL